jgi:competence protein ComEC
LGVPGVLERPAGAATPRRHGRAGSADAAYLLTGLAGLTAGLAAAQLVAPADPAPPTLLGAAGVAILTLAPPRRASGARHAAWLASVAVAAAALGVGWGVWRLATIDAGALDLEAGTPATATGHVLAAPRRSSGKARIQARTADGKVLIESAAPSPDLSPGDAVRATGQIRDPLPWEEPYLRRSGIRDVLVASRVTRLEAPREGLAGWLDGIRRRVEGALERGTGEAPASLLRGFVLGQDDRIAPETVEAFRRSGLAHLLAVSGTNVMLLSLLAGAVLALLGVPLRARLACVLALIAVYVPVAGASPSIQRAGVMGVAGVVAVLASRPRSRGYALLLAAATTLALNPRACGEVGWQLSFAAVVGIILWTGQLRELLQRPGAERRSPLRRTVAGGAALTIAATLATAPLMAHHFDAFSITSLPANLLALPAVAPVMWLGMAAGTLGQVPGAPVEPISVLGGAVAAYIGQVAGWMASPRWAMLELELVSPIAVAVAYVMLGGALTLVLRWWRRRRALRPRAALVPAGLIAAALVVSLAMPATVESLVGEGAPPYEVPPKALTVSVLDVGQGDAILLDPGDGPSVLVDAGPPGAGVAAQLRERGIDRLGALVITHPDADHAGGAAEILAALPAEVLAQANPDPGLHALARASGARPSRLAAGDELRSGSLHLDVIWPPARLLALDWAREQPNRLSIVLLARFKGFRMLLTGDAEAEVTPLDPGPIDVLKLAHHGSEDPGLTALLARTTPGLGVVSAGEENPHGHPAPATLAALADHGVRVLRTDTDGELRIEVARRAWRAAPAASR